MPISEVYNIDCMEYMKNISDKFFDLAVVDPPIWNQCYIDEYGGAYYNKAR